MKVECIIARSYSCLIIITT